MVDFKNEFETINHVHKHIDTIAPLLSDDPSTYLIVKKGTSVIPVYAEHAKDVMRGRYIFHVVRDTEVLTNRPWYFLKGDVYVVNGVLRDIFRLNDIIYNFASMYGFIRFPMMKDFTVLGFITSQINIQAYVP